MTSLTQPVDRADARTVPPAAVVAPAPKPTDPLAHLPLETIQWIALDRIQESALNPRKDFDKESIAELAESIRARGLQQNLIVRPLKKADHYELMGGARRLRALRLLKAEGAMCKVVAADDGQSLAAQIVENLQRQDLAPLEEAEAFAKLQAQDPKVWTAPAIAKAVGKTDRFVQQRIAIATGLTPGLKSKFEAGKLSVEIARTLAPLPASVQEKVGDSWAVNEGNVERVRSVIRDTIIPESAAKFDVALYDGQWIEEKGKRFFADIAKFRALQLKAAGDVLAKVRADWPKAELLGTEEPGDWNWADETWGSPVRHGGVRPNNTARRFVIPKEKCTAIVWVNAAGQICRALGVCSPATLAAARNAREQKQADKSKKAAQARIEATTESKEAKAVRQKFNADLVAALRNDELARHRLHLLQLIADDYPSLVGNFDPKAVPKELQKFIGGNIYSETELAASWEAVSKLTPAVVRSAIVDQMVGLIEWDEFDWEKCPPFIAAIAASVKVKVPEPVKPAQKKAEAAKPTKAKAAPKAKAKKPAAKKKGAKK
jgi:ParB/RepB/Spo0J family partition protein